jgi:hypothetical protein
LGGRVGSPAPSAGLGYGAGSAGGGSSSAGRSGFVIVEEFY